MKSGHMFTIGGKGLDGIVPWVSSLLQAFVKAASALSFGPENQFHRIMKNKKTRKNIGMIATEAIPIPRPERKEYTLAVRIIQSIYNDFSDDDIYGRVSK